MNKAELMREVAKRTDYLLKDTETIIEGLIEVIQEQLTNRTKLTVPTHWATTHATPAAAQRAVALCRCALVPQP